MKTINCAAAFALIIALAPAVAQAQCPTGVQSSLYGLGGLRGLYGNGHFEKRPYFALNPPVYYSQPVARPYGYSPYALPPGALPVEPQISETPAAIVNPFFTSGKVEKNKKDTSRDRATSFGTDSAKSADEKAGVQQNPFYQPKKNASSGYFTAVE